LTILALVKIFFFKPINSAAMKQNVPKKTNKLNFKNSHYKATEK